jgi:hypothetical protein
MVRLWDLWPEPVAGAPVEVTAAEAEEIRHCGGRADRAVMLADNGALAPSEVSRASGGAVGASSSRPTCALTVTRESSNSQ